MKSGSLICIVIAYKLLNNMYLFRTIRMNMPCTVEAATRCSDLYNTMLTKCKPQKGKAKSDPTHATRRKFLDFLFESYKASINNRHPSRTGELNLINDFLAKMIHEYIFGNQEKLIFTDGKKIFTAQFPTAKSKTFM